MDAITTPITTAIRPDSTRPDADLTDTRADLRYGGTQAAVLIAVAGAAAAGSGTAAVSVTGIGQAAALVATLAFGFATALLTLAARPNLVPDVELARYAYRRHRLVRAALDAGLVGVVIALIGLVATVAMT